MKEEKRPVKKDLKTRPVKVLTSANLAQLVLLGEEHSGRDEMNLAGHPFALLQAPGRCVSSEPIFYQWPRTLPDGKSVTASWRVQPGAHSGMPGPNEELLYLVMLQMTREAAGENEQWPQVVPFSRGALLDRLGWNNGPRGFAALESAFSRLNAVSISAQWAFYDARTAAPMKSVMFHILSGVAITPEPMGRKRSGALPLSWWKWDDIVYSSLLADNVRSLALDFTLSLSSPTARRLFRLLDLLRNAAQSPRQEVAIGTFKLRDRLGMAPYKHQSKVKEKLLAGTQELQSTGYLSQVTWETMRGGSPLAVFQFGNPQSPPSKIRPIEAQSFVRGDVEEAPQEFARRMHEAFTALSEAEKAALREAARAGVAPAFWDKIDSPDSPMSLGLWELVAAKIET